MQSKCWVRNVQAISPMPSRDIDPPNAGRNDLGVNLVVLRKREGRWMIVAHEAAVPDPASAVQSLKDR